MLTKKHALGKEGNPPLAIRAKACFACPTQGVGVNVEFILDTSKMCKHVEIRDISDSPIKGVAGYPDITKYHVGCSEFAIKDGLCEKHKIEED